MDQCTKIFMCDYICSQVLKSMENEKKRCKNSTSKIQCNPYQATNSIFHRTRANNLTVCMEIQKTLNSQSNLEKEEWNWRNQPA